MAHPVRMIWYNIIPEVAHPVRMIWYNVIPEMAYPVSLLRMGMGILFHRKLIFPKPSKAAASKPFSSSVCDNFG